MNQSSNERWLQLVDHLSSELDEKRRALVHIAAIALTALVTDGGHHKQQALADIAYTAGIKSDTLASLDVDVGFVVPRVEKRT